MIDLMQPVLFTLGQQPISSLGLFLVIAISAALFVVWRLILAYELNKDKTIDLMILTFIGGFISARIFFVLFHLNEFNTLSKIAFFNRYPGLSFWGGLFGGMFIFRYLCYRNKYKFWQMADYLIVALFLAISITSLGCLFGSCQSGMPYESFFSVRQVGLVGKRFPLQLFESLFFLIAFYSLWKGVLKFHFDGQIAAKGLMILGTLKFFLEFLRGDSQKIISFLSLGHIYALSVFALGLYAYYTQGTRYIVADLRFLVSLTSNASRQKQVVSKLKKSCYNLIVNWKLKFEKFSKKLPRRLNVKANPKEF